MSAPRLGPSRGVGGRHLFAAAPSRQRHADAIEEVSTRVRDWLDDIESREARSYARDLSTRLPALPFPRDPPVHRSAFDVTHRSFGTHAPIYLGARPATFPPSFKLNRRNRV